MAFKLFWAVPIVGIYYTIKNKNIYNTITICLIIVCALCQLVIVSDTSRQMGLAFLSIIVGIKEIKKYYSNSLFQKALYTLLFFNFLVPQYYVAQSHVTPFFSMPMSLIYEMLSFPWRIDDLIGNI